MSKVEAKQVGDDDQRHSGLLESNQSTYMEPEYDSSIITTTLYMYHAGGEVEQHVVTNEETNSYFKSLLNNFRVEFERGLMVNHDAKAENERLTTKLAQYKGQQIIFENNEQKLETGASAAVIMEDFDTIGVDPLNNSANIRLNRKTNSFDVVTVLAA
ncbi:hypothetical protein Tco_1385329 [Tanacetum coccineum]